MCDVIQILETFNINSNVSSLNILLFLLFFFYPSMFFAWFHIHFVYVIMVLCLGM